MSLLTSSRPISTIETKPLIGIVFALALGALPLAPRVAGWVLPLMFICCIGRLVMNRPASRLPSLPVKVILFALGIGGVGLTYGSMVGIDPGLSILLVLVSLKLVETNGDRDFHVLVLLGYFLALCDLFFSQDLIVWLYVALVIVLITATLARFHRGPVAGGYRSSALLALKLFAQTLPLVVMLFLLFPRIYGGFRFQFSQSLLASSGMSDRLSPGSFSSLVLSDQIAFRADFPDGSIPPMSSMYWRGGVLWGCDRGGDGLNWVIGPRLNQEKGSENLAGGAVRQRISLQPHGGRWLFALDRPASNVRGATYQPGGYLRSQRNVTTQFRYPVVSFPENREATLLPDHRLEATRPPAVVSPRVQALVNGWKKEHNDPAELINAALYFFRKERFVYSLSPGNYEERNGLETFLFERREGFCEHYAAAFATLMRVAGIPSRVVIGYHGGEFNTLGKYVIVRQADAHAWCEVWIKDSGWERIDPTDMIAPERLSSGLASYLQTRAAQADPQAAQSSLTAAGWRELQREIQNSLRLFWDNANYQWDLRVLSYDEDTQQNFLMTLGLGAVSWPEMVIWMVVGIAVLLALLTLWLRRPSRGGGDEVARAYVRFCEVLARAGLRREPWEGPQHFGERAAASFAAQAEIIREVTSLYIARRYGAQAAAAAPAPLIRAVREFRKVRLKDCRKSAHESRE